MVKFSNNLTAQYKHYRKYVNKRTKQSVALAVATFLLVTGAYMDDAPVNEVFSTNVEIQPASTAGVFSAVSAIELSAGSNLGYASADVTVVAATSDQVEPDTDDAYDEWSDKVVANVNDYIYVRTEADVA